MTRSTDILRVEGHTLEGGRCDKCWRTAALLYAGGQGPFGSHTEAYYSAMALAQLDADQRARAEADGAALAREDG